MSHASEMLSLFLRQKQIQIPESGLTPEPQRALSLLAGNNKKEMGRLSAKLLDK